MPFIDITTTRALLPEQKEALHAALTENLQALAIPRNGADWLMSRIEGAEALRFNQSTQQASACAKIYTLGKCPQEIYERLTADVCSTLSALLDIAPSEIFVLYFAVSHWGWNGKNF